MANAADFTQDSVLYFLQSKGGTVKNSDLLFHYKSFLRDHENQAQYRERFKKFVNSVATVKQEEGINYVVLRKKFRGHLPRDIPSGGHSSKQAGPDQAERRDRNPEKPPLQNSAEITPKQPNPPHRDLISHAPLGEVPKTTERLVLPSAGILNNNHVETNFNLDKPLQSSSPYARESHATSTNFPYNTKPAVPGGTGSNQNSEEAELSLPEFNQREHSYTCAKLGQSREPLDHQRGNYCPSVHLQPKAAPLKPEEIPKQTATGGGPQFDHLQVTRRHARHRQSYKTAVSYDGDFEEEEEDQRRPGSAGGVWPLNIPLEQTGRTISNSSPCISDPPAPLPCTSSTPPLTNLEVRDRNDCLPGSRLEGVPVICIQDTEGEREATHGPRRSLGLELEHGWKMGPFPGDSKPLRSSLPLEAEYYTPSPDRAEYTEPYRSQSHHDKHLHLNPSGQRLDPGIGSGLGSRLDPGLGSGLDPILDSGLGSRLDPGLGSGLDPILDSGLGSRLDPGLEPGMRPKLGPGSGLSSSHSSIFPPSSEDYSCSDWPRSASPRGSGWDSSDEALHTSTGELGGEAKVQEMLRRAKETKLLALMHRAERKSTAPWHHSTGHLADDDPTSTVSPWHHSAGHLHDDSKEEAESSDGSTSSVVLRQRPAIDRRVSSRLRSRMCRSLGADLDQPFPEEVRGGASARHNRLHLLSSSFSLRYTLSSSSLSSCSTPSRCQSFGDLAEEENGSGVKKSLPSSSSSALHDGSKSHQQQELVPLEPRVHVWMVKGAVGSWSDIYSLFREDPTLLNRRDFISGYTVLHWIAKHGDHRVLNTLWYGVHKTGMTLDVDAKSVCGYTPLHLAAIHSHKKMMRLLVHKFKASVALRDTSGRKPWQYVGRPGPIDVLQLLGAPQWAVKKGVEAGSQHLHHSSSSVDKHHKARPITLSGMAKVKRSSSIAAFLKHKSLLRLTGQYSDSSV